MEVITIFSFLNFISLRMKKVGFLVAVLFLISNLLAQVNKYGYPISRFYSPTEINSNGQNWAIAKAPNGLIYVANNLSGVLEYDGESWRTIRIEGEPEVRALAISKSGVIYVGCSTEFGYLQPTKSGSYEYVKISQALPDSVKNFSAFRNINIVNDTVFFSNDKFKIFGYIPEKDSLIIINTPKYTFFTFGLNKSIYGGSYIEGMFKVSKNGTIPVKGGEFYKFKDIFSILDHGDSKIVVTGIKGIFGLDDKTGISTPLTTSKTLNKFKDCLLYSADNDQQFIYTGTLGSGILVFNYSGELIAKLNKEIGIQDDVCSSVKSYGKVLWGTMSLGLANVEFSNPIRYFGESSGLNGIVNDIINFEGTLFVGTDIGLYYLSFDENEQPRFKKVSGIDNQVWSLSIMHLRNSQKEILLIGTNLGIYQLNGLHQGVISIEENLNGIEQLFPTIEKDELKSVKLYTYKLFASKETNILWCGTADRLLGIKYNGNNQWSATKAIYKLGNKILSITDDEFGNVFATANKKGLVKVNPSTFSYQVFDSTNGLPIINDIRAFKYNNTIVVATRKGLFEFNNNEGKIGLFSNIPEEYINGELAINRFLQLSDSSIVLSVSEGGVSRNDFLIYEHNKYILEPFKFKRTPNVDSEVFYEKDRHIWFTNSNLVYNLDLNKEYQLDSTYNCLIRKVEGLDSVYFLGNFYSETEHGLQLSSKQLEHQKPILRFTQNDLTFHYAAPFFEGDEEIVYSYKLEGFKNQWSKWNKEPKAVFTNLNAGQYTFMVKAKNIYDIESHVGTYSFSVLPPWYRTIVAYIFYGILIILAIWLIVKLYTRKLKLEKIRLEGIVRERTAEIREQRDQIADQKKSIEDSILYASRIQRAILPSKEMADSILPEYFILFRPRDIVSGDYYWMNKIGNKTIVVAADCTGHGVPGAFMSMLGVSFLNEIVLKENVLEAHIILNHLRERVKKTLKQEGKEGENKDGMDVALIVIDDEAKKLFFAGAYNPAYILRGEELIEIKADRMPIGIYIKEKESFTLNEFDYLPGDSFYIFSDGYEDQFGGPGKQKFRAKQMRELLLTIQDKSMAEQKEILNKTIEDWMGDDQEQIDDMVVVGVRLS
ncbi:MAG TPA: hypothetical protein DCQ26_13155 [Marinilabiliales bacterium]|nr:MAG: hypothetical protein A2W95_08480 [Bacteroidetes bacterium GWA2_40_14]OFZ26326.1 MAG: hypothetical protein A2437_03180 [Bacteroidetes bacterium RIFOXYC2_FULL_40_12]HAM99550.1 hypothetical protein [Marinilabiliales bacterium]HBY52947.1 hypothetical protein [Marinilabiliales bacterium]